MDLREQLEAHVEFLKELGIEGMSRDAWWRLPTAATAATAERVEAVSAASQPQPREAGPKRAEAVPSESQKQPRDHGSRLAGAVPVASQTRLDEPDPDHTETLEDIRRDLGDCTRCKLHRLGRHKIVFGSGNPRADLMFVGEGPGHDEDMQGLPFVGRAGQLLTKMIAAIELSRDEVYIANVVKCRPPENRAPEPDETAACQPFLVRQVRTVRPKVLVALGASAARTLLDWKGPVSRLRGRVYDYAGARLVVTFHPAYLLRNPASKREAWEDLKLVKKLLGEGNAR